MKKLFGWLGNDIFLGTLIAVVSVLTAVASYQGAMSDSEQNKFEILGMQALNDGNAEYLTSNQDILQDYSYYDNWYLNVDERPEIAEYYEFNFSPSLQAAIERDPDVVWDEQYYDEMYEIPSGYFDESDANFQLGADWDERGDQLQLVVLILALAIAFTAWAALLGSESVMRLFFAFFGLVMFVIGLYTYLVVVPPVPV
jgi:hypothetical protein